MIDYEPWGRPGRQLLGSLRSTLLALGARGMPASVPVLIEAGHLRSAGGVRSTLPRWEEERVLLSALLPVVTCASAPLFVTRTA